MTPDPIPTKRPEPRLSAFFSPITELPSDAPVSVTGELGVQLRHDEADAYRQVLARHRWLRTAVAFLVAIIALEGGSMASPGEAAVALVGYTAIVHLAWFTVRAGRTTSVALVLNAVGATLAADVLLGAMLVSADAASLLRFLVLGGLVSWVAAYFFSWRFAVGVGAGYVAAYILFAMTVPGLDHTVTFHAANLALFTGVVGLATWTFARQRRFYAELHVFCRQVARGDIGIRLPLASSQSGNAVVRLARDIDMMRKGLAEQIGVDALTGCLNRRALESRLRGEWRLARRRGSLVAVAAVDVDHFKLINDSHGHAAGDEVLQRLALIMKACARESDAVARLGGDEFVMILPDTDAEGARRVSERVRERVAATVFGTATVPITVTVSMGAVSLAGTDNLAPSDVLDMADRALYQSKQQGRNRVSFSGH
jgi:diguanylate cyclase (GGDEF)-like protein